MKKVLLVALILLFPIALVSQEKKFHGFAFSQYTMAEGQPSGFGTFRVRAFMDGRIEGQIDVDFKRSGNELNQAYLGIRTKYGTIRAGRFLMADPYHTVAPHLFKTAFYPESEGALGPFCGWGVQYDKKIGANWNITADAAYQNGKYYSITDGDNFVGGLYAKRSFSNDQFIAIGGRQGNHVRRLSFDSEFKAASFVFRNSAFYTDEPMKSEDESRNRLTGISLAEWRPGKSLFALHAQADVPIKNNPVVLVGMSIGSTKNIYFVVDRELNEKERWAARLHVRRNF